MFYSVKKDSFPINQNHAYLLVILGISIAFFVFSNICVKICSHSIASSKVSTYNLCRSNWYTMTECVVVWQFSQLYYNKISFVWRHWTNRPRRKFFLNKHVIQQFAYNYAVCVLKYHKNIKLLVIIFPQQNGRFFYENRKVLSPACTSSVCHSFLQGLI